MRRHGTRHPSLLALVVLLAAPAGAQEIPPERAEEIIREVQQSHIDGNVPPEADFDRLLRRDLVAYFASGEDPTPEVSYELLRKGPTQTGIAYPKFYAWVSVRREGHPTREGAVRLAAIDRQRFEIMQFIDQSEIRRNPSGLDQVFPPPVASAIKVRVGSAAP
jgi:hypothetical protein